jgi:hypothetical protein
MNKCEAFHYITFTGNTLLAKVYDSAFRNIPNQLLLRQLEIHLVPRD